MGIICAAIHGHRADSTLHHLESKILSCCLVCLCSSFKNSLPLKHNHRVHLCFQLSFSRHADHYILLLESSSFWKLATVSHSNLFLCPKYANTFPSLTTGISTHLNIFSKTRSLSPRYADVFVHALIDKTIQDQNCIRQNYICIRFSHRISSNQKIIHSQN